MVTNQAGIARGLLLRRRCTRPTPRWSRSSPAGGARLDGLYVCTHHPGEGAPPYRADCDCRKPRPGLLHARRRRARPRPPGLGDGGRQALRRGGRAVGGRRGRARAHRATAAGSGSTSRHALADQAGLTWPRTCSTPSSGRSRGRHGVTCSRVRGWALVAASRPAHRGGRRSHRRRVPLRQARAHLARGAGPDPALHRRARCAWAAPPTPPTTSTRSAPPCCRWAWSATTRRATSCSAPLRGGRHRDRRARAVGGAATPVKTRIMAGGYESTRQQVVRLDREPDGQLAPRGGRA